MVCKFRAAVSGLIVGVVLMLPGLAEAEPLRVFTAGAFKQVLLALVPQFEKDGHSIAIEADTVGGLINRVEQAERFDLVIASSAALARLRTAGKVADANIDLARVGVGVGVRDDAERPDIATVEGFKRALLRARAVAYVDPASGGTSGIYLSGLLDRLGIGPEVRAKSVLVNGGFSADRLVSGEADIAIQQISEILPVKGVVLVGPLPAELQSYTTYAAGLPLKTGEGAAANALIALLRSEAGATAIRSKGMEPAF